MKKYRITFIVTSKQQLNPILTGTEIAVTIEAPHEKAATHRAWMLFTNNRLLVRDGDGLEIAKIEEVM